MLYLLIQECGCSFEIYKFGGTVITIFNTRMEVPRFKHKVTTGQSLVWGSRTVLLRPHSAAMATVSGRLHGWHKIFPVKGRYKHNPCSKEAVQNVRTHNWRCQTL